MFEQSCLFYGLMASHAGIWHVNQPELAVGYVGVGEHLRQCLIVTLYYRDMVLVSQKIFLYKRERHYRLGVLRL